MAPPEDTLSGIDDELEPPVRGPARRPLSRNEVIDFLNQLQSDPDLHRILREIDQSTDEMPLVHP